MVEIFGEAALRAVFGEWRPSFLAFIDRLAFEVDISGKASVEIVSTWQSQDGRPDWPDPDAPTATVGLRFTGVVSLKLQQLTTGRIQVMGFDIINVTDRGWESIRYEIRDCEDGRISFFCEDVQVVSVKQNE